MRGITVQLPDLARSKLQDLVLARDAALDAARSAGTRLQQLSRDADQLMRDRLTSERDKQNHKHGQLSQLVSRCNQWLAELRPGTALELVPPQVIEHKLGTDLITAINTAREEITATRQHLLAVKTSPLPKADQKRLAAQYVDRLRHAGKVSVAIVNDQLRLSFTGDIFAPEDQLAMIAQFAHEQVLAELERAIDALPTRADSMPRTERVKRTAELEAQLLELENLEEALVTRAHGDGLVDILRRVDADPRAVLIVVVAAKVKEVAA